MEDTYNISALVLSRQSYRENDSLVLVYAKETGLLELVAKGAKKASSKLAGHLEPLTLSDIMVIRGRGRHYVGSACNRQSYLAIKQDLNKLYYAGQALGFLKKLIKGRQADENLFRLLIDWLDVLSDYSVEPNHELAKEAGEILLIFFSWRLLAELGYSPGLAHCLSCEKAIDSGLNYFDLTSGGLLHPDCARLGGQLRTHLSPLSYNSVKLLRFVLVYNLSLARQLKAGQKIRREILGLARDFTPYLS